MANQIQKKVNKSIKKTRLNKLIMRHQQEASVLRKLIFIRFLYNKHTLNQVSPQNLSNSPIMICKTSEKNIQIQKS